MFAILALLMIVLFSVAVFIAWTVTVTHGVADYWIDMQRFPFVWEAVFDLLGACLSVGIGYVLMRSVL